MRSCSSSMATVLQRRNTLRRPLATCGASRLAHLLGAGCRLEREPADPAVARVERGIASGRSGRAAVAVAQGIAKRVVARGAAEGLDVLVLVERRDALRAQLAAEPVGLLDQAGAAAAPRRRQRRGDAAQAAARDQHVAFDLVRRGRVADAAARRRRRRPRRGTRMTSTSSSSRRSIALPRHRARQPERDLREGDHDAERDRPAAPCTAGSTGRCRRARSSAARRP